MQILIWLFKEERLNTAFFFDRYWSKIALELFEFSRKDATSPENNSKCVRYKTSYESPTFQKSQEQKFPADNRDGQPLHENLALMF